MGWGGLTADAINAASAEEFYKLFKQTQGADLRRMVKGALRFGGVGGQVETGNKVREALLRIADESPLNALRIANYGVGKQKEEVE